MNTRQQGEQGERVAEDYLVAQGMALIARNLRYPNGEVDLVMRDGNYTVFVEVKRRFGTRYGTGREAVTLTKRRRICAVALRYLRANGLLGTATRFDVVEIHGEVINHLPNAFPYTPPARGRGFF
ncbi:MAG: YraN family protein [Clostridia bacterium]|nr:YraN family protein [Clostridia bacterium]